MSLTTNTLYDTLRHNLIEGKYTIYKEGKNLLERGFKENEFSPDRVYLDAAVDPDEKYGRIIQINSQHANFAMVQIGGNKEDMRLVHSTHMFAMNWFGIEREDVRDEDFKIGDVVYVAEAYSEKVGVIKNLSDDIKGKAWVELPHKNGGAAACWIKFEHLINTDYTIPSANIGFKD